MENKSFREIPKMILSRAETARFFNASLPTIDAWRNRVVDPLPCIKTGKKCLFSLPMIMEWFERQAGKEFN